MSPFPRWVIPVVFVGFLLAIAVALAIRGAKVARQRAAELKALAERLGLAILEKGDKEFVKAWSAVKPLKSSGKATNILYGRLDSGRDLTAFSHTYVVSTGKSAHAVTHTVAAYDCPAWPAFSVQRRNALVAAVRSLFKKPDPADGAASFESEWVVEAADPDWKRALLTPELMGMLAAQHKTFAGLWVREGKLAVLFSGALNVESLERALAAIEPAMVAMESLHGVEGHAWAETGEN